MTNPSTLAFGPQERCPSSATIKQLRHALQNDRAFTPIHTCLEQMPAFWEVVLKNDEQMQLISGSKRAAALHGLLFNGENYEDDCTANQITMPLSVLVHLVQYRQFLRQNSSTSHASLMQDVAARGIHGFCAGLLSAFAVSSMKTEDDFGACATFAIKLAMCIGAYIDLAMVLSNRETASAIVRWSTVDGRDYVDKAVARYTDAYVSVISDENSITLTASPSDLAGITASLSSLGMSCKMLAMTGSFHNSRNKDINSRILSFLRTPQLSPPQFQLTAPIRSNSTGDLWSGLDTVQYIVDDILCNLANWRLTMDKTLASLRTVPTSNAHIQTFGLVEFIPSFVKTEVKVTPQRLLPVSESPLTIPSSESEELRYRDDAIAVVGMACRFPGADDLDQFWELLASGKSMHKRMPSDRFETTGLRRSAEDAPFWGNFLEDIDAFDHQFFKKSSREAASMDPQQRLLLQCAYVAMEDAGYFSPSSVPVKKDVGVYVGACSSDYNDNVASHKPTAYSTLGTLRAFLTGRISHWFDWTGPSIVYDTACSSSAVAIDAACKAIISGECSQALAGGVSLYTSPNFYQNLGTASFLSPTGPCKPFDAKADGYCRGEGVGLVVLKKLSDAIQDGDRIAAVIASTGVNQNRNCTGITVPHGDSQADLYRKVVTKSGFDALQVSYVEAHGTGTPVGDPIEFNSIKSVFTNPSRESPLAIASVKGNIGHLEGAAGVASLIKVCLMLRNSAIPPQANFEKINPKIASGTSSQILIPTSTQSWSTKHKVACINNYGAAGSNAAMVVCQPPQPTAASDKVQIHRNSSYPLYISGSDADAVKANYGSIMAFVRRIQQTQPAEIFFPSLAHALAVSQNRQLSHAIITTISNLGDLEAANPDKRAAATQIQPNSRQPVVLCFGGQVKNFVGLDQGLFDSSLLLQSHLQNCDLVMRRLGYPGLFPVIFQSEAVDDIVQLHGMLFALQYASAKAWIDSGLQPDALVGHSFGQLTALAVGGSISLEDGLKLVCGRARLIKELWGPHPGAMIAVEAPIASAQMVQSAALKAGHDVEFACYNASESHVLVGTAEAIDAVERELLDLEIKHKRLSVTYGFHSVFTEPLLPGLARLAEGLHFNSPEIPIETCTEHCSWSLATPDLIAQHTRQPVYFARAVERISARLGPCTWVEASTGASTPGMVKRILPNATTDTFVHTNIGSSNASALLAETTASLWRCNQQVQFWGFHAIQRHSYQSLNLPGYQFRQSKHWLAWQDTVSAPISEQLVAPPVPETHELLGTPVFEDPENTLARFNVDAQSEEFMLLVKGHAVVAQPLCPAPLYCELALRAVELLSPNQSHRDHEIRNLQIHSPLGLDTRRSIYLVVRAGPTQGLWDFSLESSRGSEDQRSHANGQVVLQPDQQTTTYELMSYQRLVGHQKIQLLQDDPVCDVLKGSTIYKSFARVVTYAPYYKGVQAVYGQDCEACGIVSLPPDKQAMVPQQDILAPLLIDNFFQIAGLHINVLGDCDDHLVFVCTETQRMINGLDANQPLASRYEVYSTLSRESNKAAVCDIVVFDAESKSVRFVAIGARFNRVSIEGLRRALGAANQTVSKSIEPSTLDQRPKLPTIVVEKSTAPTIPEGLDLASDPPAVLSLDLLPKVKALLNKVSDVPVEKIQADSSLDDLGIDSLMVMEVQTEVQSQFQLTIPTKDWATLETPEKLAGYLEKATVRPTIQTTETPASRLSCPPSPTHSSSTSNIDSDRGFYDSSATSDSGFNDQYKDAEAKTPAVLGEAAQFPLEPTERLPSHEPVNMCAQRTFTEVRSAYDTYAEQEGFSGFWSKVYPTQKYLTLAYVVEAFQQLGCDLDSISAGQTLPEIQYLPEHEQLVRQLYAILMDSNLIVAQGDKYSRTALPIDRTPASEWLLKITHLAPQHEEEHKLLAVIGSRLGDCLVGRADPLRLLFMDRQNKDLLENVYAHGPMYKAMSRLLGSYLLATISQWNGQRPLRILEIGGGTGGTTKHIVAMLHQRGYNFEYTFSDLSRGLVASAKKKFSIYHQMKFVALDIESAPPSEHMGQYDLIVSTNCIHATKNLQETSKHMRQLLSSEGFICLVEFTRNIFWFDLVFGLLDGWWRFEDGRTHVLADKSFWNCSLRAAGFGDVQWTDGISEEAKTLRLITAFNTSSQDAAPQEALRAPRQKQTQNFQTVRWKQEGALDLMADIYLPGNHDVLAAERPIALMLHGGGHVLHTRKHINRRHVGTLLELGFLPVSVDYRLCPEVNIRDGPMRDAYEAVDWARNFLPSMSLDCSGLQIDSERIVVIGYSTGGHLALTTAFTTMEGGIRPPSAILGFYCPTNYNSDWWRSPIYPQLAQQPSTEAFDLLEGVQESPIAEYSPSVNRNVAALLMSLEDPRWRFVLHMNWCAQTLPVLLNGLPSKSQLAHSGHSLDSILNMEVPDDEAIASISPYEQILRGNYITPTYLLHGTADDLIPWQQSRQTAEALAQRGVPAKAEIIEGAGHVFDVWSSQWSEEVAQAFDWLVEQCRLSS